MGQGTLLLATVLLLGLSAIQDAPSRPAPLGPDPTAPRRLASPPLAQDEASILLVWEKAERYGEVADYRVYIDGQPAGTARENAALHSPAQPYIEKFYEGDRDGFHVRVQYHSYTATGLRADTSYRFRVTALLRDGRESAPSEEIAVRTTPVPRVFDVIAHGAVGDGATLNTAAIQRAIDACTPGGKVLVPAGTFKTGALFLKSDMTLEIAEGAVLLGSERAEDYPIAKGYTLYDYFSEMRSPSLLNAVDPAKRDVGTFSNIRIVGKGTIDGNGWKRTAAATIPDELGRPLPQWIASNNTHVTERDGGDGVLARTQMLAGLAAGASRNSAYTNWRSSLITLRGVRHAYYAGLTMVNPANHVVVNLDSDHVTVNGLVIKTYDANNADGVEFGNGDGLIVVNTFMDTGDDCVNFAAGVGKGATVQRPSRRAWIFNNYFREGHGAVVLGSHTGAWIEDILAEDNVMHLTDVGLRAKSTVQTGGGGRHVVFRDNAMRGISSEAFIVTLDYTVQNLAYAPADAPARFHDFLVRNVSVDGSPSMRSSIHATGTATGPGYHERLRFEQVRMRNVGPVKIDFLRDSTFHDVVFTDWTPERPDPWTITNASGLQFTGTTSPRPTFRSPATRDTPR